MIVYKSIFTQGMQGNRSILASIAKPFSDEDRRLQKNKVMKRVRKTI